MLSMISEDDEKGNTQARVRSENLTVISSRSTDQSTWAGRESPESDDFDSEKVHAGSPDARRLRKEF